MVLPLYWGSLLPMVDTDGDGSPDALAVETHNEDLAAIKEAVEDTTPVDTTDAASMADDAAFTVGTSEVSVAGFLADEESTDSVDEGDAGAARMTLDRKQIATLQPHTKGGLSVHKSLDLDEGAVEVVKASAGMVYGWVLTNRATSTRYVKFYNATSGNVGTLTPLFVIPVPGNSTDHTTGFLMAALGIEFSTGICIGASTGFADNDTGAPATNDVLATVFFK